MRLRMFDIGIDRIVSLWGLAMDILIRDQIVRVFFQVVLTIFVISISVVSLIFIYATYARIFAFRQSDDLFIRYFMRFLIVLSGSSFAPMVAAVVGVFPLVVSAVCYRRIHERKPIELSSDLNDTGYVALFVLFFGMIAATISLITIEANIDAMTGFYSKDNMTVIRSLFSAILSLQAIYFVQLAGLKPK